jgi:hypothetical protein
MLCYRGDPMPVAYGVAAASKLARSPDPWWDRGLTVKVSEIAS